MYFLYENSQGVVEYTKRLAHECIFRPNILKDVVQ